MAVERAYALIATTKSRAEKPYRLVLDERDRWVAPFAPSSTA
jgi:hypothetical protein